MKAIAVILLAGFLTACDKPVPASTGPDAALPPPPETYTVDIYWKAGDEYCEVSRVEARDANCEVDNKSDVCARRGDFIVWQSNEPSDAKFAIYFDPIQGGQVQTGSGKIRKKIDDGAPIAEYKYSIVRDGCDPNLENTYDPRIRIDP